MTASKQALILIVFTIIGIFLGMQLYTMNVKRKANKIKNIDQALTSGNVSGDASYNLLAQKQRLQNEINA